MRLYHICAVERAPPALVKWCVMPIESVSPCQQVPVPVQGGFTYTDSILQTWKSPCTNDHIQSVERQGNAGLSGSGNFAPAAARSMRCHSCNHQLVLIWYQTSFYSGWFISDVADQGRATLLEQEAPMHARNKRTHPCMHAVCWATPCVQLRARCACTRNCGRRSECTYKTRSLLRWQAAVPARRRQMQCRVVVRGWTTTARASFVAHRTSTCGAGRGI